MRLSALLLLATLAGCSSQPWYKDAAAYAQDLADWSLEKKPLGEAIASLQDKGFACAKGSKPYPYECSRRVGRFPCSQTQAISLELEPNQATVRKVVPHSLANGELPSACL